MSALTALGVTATTVRRAVAAGIVEQMSRGTYRIAGAPHEEAMHLAEALVRIPRGIICLHSAAQVHGLGDHAPARVWVALPNRLHPPRLDWPPIRFVLWRGDAAFQVGVEEREICGVAVRITAPSRTVVDMLRMRSTVGEETALRCLRDYFGMGHSAAALVACATALGVGDRLSPLLKAATVFGGAP